MQGHAQRPEVRIVTRQNEELATDALSIHGYEHYKAKDYVLAHAPFIGAFVSQLFQDDCAKVVTVRLELCEYDLGCILF